MHYGWNLQKITAKMIHFANKSHSFLGNGKNFYVVKLFIYFDSVFSLFKGKKGFTIVGKTFEFPTIVPLSHLGVF